MPFSNPHQVIKGEFYGESTVSADFGKGTLPVMRRHGRLVAVWKEKDSNYLWNRLRSSVVKLYKKLAKKQAR